MKNKVFKLIRFTERGFAMSITHKWRGVFCSPRKGEQCSGTGNNGKKQFHHFRLTTDSIGRHSIPGISMALIMAVLLVSTTAYADRRHHGKYHHHYPSEPVHCEDLANGLGNLLSRLTTLCERSRYGGFEGASPPEAPQGYHEELAARRFDAAAACLWDVVSALNRDIDHARPWEALKGNDPHALRTHLSRWLSDLHRVAYWLRPLLPDAGQGLLDALSQVPICSCKPMFPRAR